MRSDTHPICIAVRHSDGAVMGAQYNGTVVAGDQIGQAFINRAGCAGHIQSVNADADSAHGDIIGLKEAHPGRTGKGGRHGHIGLKRTVAGSQFTGPAHHGFDKQSCGKDIHFIHIVLVLVSVVQDTARI